MLVSDKTFVEFNKAIQEIKSAIEKIIWDYLDKEYSKEYDISNCNVDELTNIIIYDITELGLEEINITQVVDENLVGLREPEQIFI